MINALNKMTPSYSSIKNFAIGIPVSMAVAVADNLFYKNVLVNFCRSTNPLISKYICLNPSTYLSRFMTLEQFQKRFFPSSVLHGIWKFMMDHSKPLLSECKRTGNILNNFYQKNAHLLGKVERDAFFELSDNTQDSRCCAPYVDTIYYAFSEELVFRLGVQKILPYLISKVVPKRISKIVSNVYFRVIASSLYFAFYHTDSSYVLDKFIGGLVYGIIYEKYGLIASTLSHSAFNLLEYNNGWRKMKCDLTHSMLRKTFHISI